MTIISSLIENARVYKDLPFLHFEKELWSYNEFYNRVLAIIDFFRVEFNFNPQRKQVVALLSSNRSEFLFTLFANIGLQNRTVLINAALSSREVQYILENANVDILFIEQALYTKHRVMLELWNKQFIIIASKWLQIPLNTSTAKNNCLLQSTYAEDDTVVLVYTSGTTGFPKGVELTHKSILAEAHAFAHTMEYSQADHHLCYLPLYHVFALLVSFFATFVSGGEFILLKSFHKDFWNDVANYHATDFTTIPTVLNILVNQPEESSHGKDLSSLKYCISGASSLAENTLINFQKRFCPVREGYGLSEATCASTVNPRHGPIRIGSIGKALNGVKVAIMNLETQEMLSPFAVGVLVICGPLLMKQYFNDPKATAAALVSVNNEIWLNTGDLAYMDNEGYVFLKGRTSELIKVKGEAVYPKEIELILNEYKDIKDSAVVGFPHDIYGEVPCAFIVPKTKPLTDFDALNLHLEKNLALFKVPQHIFQIDKLPVNSLGKVQKHLLRKIAPSLAIQDNLRMYAIDEFLKE